MIRNTYVASDASYFITLHRSGRGRTLRHYALISSGSRRETVELAPNDHRSTGGPRKWWITLDRPMHLQVTICGNTRMEAAINMAEVLRRQWYPTTAA